MSRLGAVVIVAIGSLSLACGGGEDPPGTAPAEGESPGAEGSPEAEAPLDPEWALSFEIEGRPTPVAARAELKVVEGERPVHVSITGRTSDADLVMIDLEFESLESALGPHQVQFSLPESGDHVAISSLDENWYYSQGGEIDVTVEAGGRIEGRFDIALALDTVSESGGPVVFSPSADVTTLGGTFEGDWVLNCHSRLSGHGTLIAGGGFCESLEL